MLSVAYSSTENIFFHEKYCSVNDRYVLKINENLERFQRQNMASVQLPQPTRSQAGKPEEVEFWPQPHLVSLSGNLSFVQARHTLS